MTKMSCMPALLAISRKKRVVADSKKASGDCPKVKPVEFTDSLSAKCGDKVAPCDVKVVVDDTVAAVAAATEGGDEALAKKGSLSSDFEFELHAREKSDGHGAENGVVAVASPDAVIASRTEAAAVVVDASPKLKRSCSNIETKRPGPHDAAEAPARSRSYGDLGKLPGGGGGISQETTPRGAAQQPEAASPASVRTSRTADRVMLKKRSSSQVLPSRSRKLWWRLFLWSHRNLHRPWPAARPAPACTPAAHHGGGYTSDTLEEGPAAAAADRKNKKVMVDDSPPIPNQWVAFSAENSLHDRVSAWVNSIDNDTFHIAEDDDDDDDDGDDNHYHGDGDDDVDHAIEPGDCVARPRALEVGESSGKGHGKSKRCTAADEVAQANTIIQSLNAFSSVAHISGMGLKVVPMIALFSSLRAINLSGNFIVHISPGSLPKGLHSLDLSRNKIANIEGLRELTKLRVLNLNYNRISRIGHGLSGCTALRELYLAGNKISEVEGLHRLLKLAVLDLGFNKVTTARALGQLVANYHSLRALNLVGNPVQANVGDDALRRAVTGLLPHLAYLNKQPVRPREAAAADGIVSRAALESSGGGGGRSAARRRSAAASRRLGQRGEGSGSVSGSGSGSGSGRSRSKGRQLSSSLPSRR